MVLRRRMVDGGAAGSGLIPDRVCIDVRIDIRIDGDLRAGLLTPSVKNRDKRGSQPMSAF